MRPVVKYPLAIGGGLGIAAQVKGIYFWVADNFLSAPWQDFPVDDVMLIVSAIVVPLFTMAFPASDRSPKPVVPKS